MKHIYFGIENLNLSNSQRNNLVQALRTLGPASHTQPACLCHWRTRLDGQAAIFEALFDGDNINVQAFKNRLATIFNVDSATIEHSNTSQTFDILTTAVVTFARGGTNYLRVAFFGYDGVTWPTWAQSGDECRKYLAINQEDWESVQ